MAARAKWRSSLGTLRADGPRQWIFTILLRYFLHETLWSATFFWSSGSPTNNWPNCSPAEQAEEKKQENQRFFFRLTRLNVKSLSQERLAKKDQFTIDQRKAGRVKPIDIFATQKNFTTLPTAAFIGYNIVNITEGQAGVAFPIHLFRTFLGGAFEDQLALSISVPSAQFVELPAIDAFNLINNFCSSPKTKKYCLRAKLA